MNIKKEQITDALSQIADIKNGMPNVIMGKSKGSTHWLFTIKGMPFVLHAVIDTEGVSMSMTFSVDTTQSGANLLSALLTQRLIGDGYYFHGTDNTYIHCIDLKEY